MSRRALVVAWIAAIATLLALGTWQVRRLAWKERLIAQVEARLAAPPVPAPATAGPDDAYRRVRVTGSYLPNRDSFVQALTDLGPGWWTLTPLQSVGRVILVNRGYVPHRAAPPPPRGSVTVVGLLRLSEPGGGFLRSNEPAADRWYSRDVVAIAARRGLRAAPYFIDAAATEPGGPVGGLTVVRFPNNHLVYAITWYTMALMAAAALIRWRRREARA